MIFQRAGTVGIFLWNKSTFLNWLKFTCMFLMKIQICSASLMKLMNFEKYWNFMIFLGLTLSAFFCEKIYLLWIGSNFTCMFPMIIPINPASLMKVGEICKKCWNFIIFLGLTLSAFFFELKYNFSEKAQISHACFWWLFQYVLQVLWKILCTLKKMLKFNDISRAGTVGIFLWKN